MRTFLKLITLLIFYFQAQARSQRFFWTATADGIYSTADGTTAINLNNTIPDSPNPAGTVWEPCRDNWIYFHQYEDGTAIDSEHINRMLSIALSAVKTYSRIRIGITRSESNRCYTSQIFDVGP